MSLGSSLVPRCWHVPIQPRCRPLHGLTRQDVSQDPPPVPLETPDLRSLEAPRLVRRSSCSFAKWMRRRERLHPARVGSSLLSPSPTNREVHSRGQRVQLWCRSSSLRPHFAKTHSALRPCS